MGQIPKRSQSSFLNRFIIQKKKNRKTIGYGFLNRFIIIIIKKKKTIGYGLASIGSQQAACAAIEAGLFGR